MFGKNEVLGTTYGAHSKATTEEKSGQALTVNSIFYTIQGEGPYAGEPAVFVRLTGCNLACWFCDTEFEKGALTMVHAIVGQCLALAGDVCRLVVLTGGEPMRQQIIPLCVALDNEGFTVQIETAGTVVPEPVDLGIPHGEISFTTLMATRAVKIVCSPKTSVVHSVIEEWCHDFKYIIGPARPGVEGKDGLPVESTQKRGNTAILYRHPDPSRHVWVQPCYVYWNGKPDYVVNERLTRHCVDLALKHGYRISLQQHKILGVE